MDGERSCGRIKFRQVNWFMCPGFFCRMALCLSRCASSAEGEVTCLRTVPSQQQVCPGDSYTKKRPLQPSLNKITVVRSRVWMYAKHMNPL